MGGAIIGDAVGMKSSLKSLKSAEGADGTKGGKPEALIGSRLVA